MNPSPHRKALEDKGLKLVDVAREAEVDKATATRWFQGPPPAERVLQIERITGIPRHTLRPDLYPVERETAA